MQHTTPYFSIIIPSYNVEKYISWAISSVLNQSFQDFEIIVVNDGSIDRTADIIEEFVKKTDKIHVVTHLKNESLHIARLDGVAVSNGQYVVFLDADDYFTDNALNILYDEIQKNPGYDFYEFGYIRQPSGDVVFPSFTGEDRFSAYFSRDNSPAHTMWNKAYNSVLLKKAFASLERTYINNAEDLYESIVISYYAERTYIIKKSIVNYQIGTGISTTNKDYQKTLELMRSIKTSINLLEKFILNINQSINFDNLYYRFLSYVINWYINSQKDIEGKKRLFLQLPDFFDTKIILEYLFNIEDSYDMLHSIAVSKEYRLGKIILYPLRKIKKTLLKDIIILKEMINSICKTRICFTNFGDISHDFFLIPLQKALELQHKRYKIVNYYKPHIQLFSVFGSKEEILHSKARKKIFFTGENVNDKLSGVSEYKGNCIDNVSLSFGFDYIENNNYLRFPLWLLYYFMPDDSKDKIRDKLNDFKKHYQKVKFCSLISRHDRSGIRTRIYNEILKIAPVDCPGYFLHNDDSLHNEYSNNKTVYLQQYKFNICPENSISPGYVTEKLFQSLYSGCIPIYNGWSKNPEPDILNPDIILWYNKDDENNNTSLVNEVKSLYLNDKLYRSFMDKPFFCDTAVDKIYYLLQQFTDKMQYMIKKSIKKNF